MREPVIKTMGFVTLGFIHSFWNLLLCLVRFVTFFTLKKVILISNNNKPVLCLNCLGSGVLQLGDGLVFCFPDSSAETK